jgi:ribosomal-protein-alanine N-acetyltransferase
MKHTELARKIHNMELVCFPREPWSLDMIVSEIANPHAVCVVEEYGYALGIQFPDDCELHNIAVLPEHRGQGKGERLLKNFLKMCNGEVFLEVASKNIPAVRLYEKHGFIQIGRRKSYYKDDDAICYKKAVKE